MSATSLPGDDPVADLERIPPSQQLSGKYFLGSYSGEHIAGTEFVIGAALVSLGVGTADLIWGLILGNLMAVLSWALVCSPVAVRSRMSVYDYLGRAAGKRFSLIYNLVNGVFFMILGGAMITVSASAFRVLTDIPPQTTWYPQSLSFVLLALAVGAITVWMAVKGFKLIANFASVCAPWMITMFLASGILTLPVLWNLGAAEGLTHLGGILDTFVWSGTTPDGEPGISLWVIAAWAWSVNLPLHLGMSDMSILRYARKASYGYFSAAGMFIGHFMAWVCAGLMGATAAVLLQNSLTALDPGEVAYRVLGVMGLVAVVVAGWTTSIPSLYRAGLAFQAVVPRLPAMRVDLAVGAVTTVVACFPFAFTQLLNVLSYFIIVMAPVGAIIAAEHFLLPRLGIRPFWRRHQGHDDNLPAFVTWALALVVALGLGVEGSLHLFTLFIPVWALSFVAYPLLCRAFGADSAPGVDVYAQSYGPVEPPETGVVTEQPSVNVRHPGYVIAVACLVIILGLALMSWGDPATAVNHLGAFHWWVVAPTLAYFGAALWWMRQRRERGSDSAASVPEPERS
ncbi:purine-cytosine permease family protein [Halomonas sp. V046]|uniref:purine-cytosine permease family protein n=1 Tax=Halomonas sp. V046 TaxID=3459611 RepID=UPI0040441374